MNEILRLLKFTPDEAIFIMANGKLNTHLRPEIAVVGNIVPLSGTRTQATIYSTDVTLEMIQNPYSGVHVLEYNRYDLTSVFDIILSNIKTPTTVNSLLSQITKATGIQFTEDDFENTRITEDEFWLTPKPESKRWIGSVKVIFNAETIGTHISQCLADPVRDR